MSPAGLPDSTHHKTFPHGARKSIELAARVTAVSELLNMADMLSKSGLPAVRAVAEAILQRVLLLAEEKAEPAFYDDTQTSRLLKRTLKRLSAARENAPRKADG